MVTYGSIIGVIKGDARRLDCGSYRPIVQKLRVSACYVDGLSFRFRVLSRIASLRC